MWSAESAMRDVAPVGIATARLRAGRASRAPLGLVGDDAIDDLPANERPVPTWMELRIQNGIFEQYVLQCEREDQVDQPTASRPEERGPRTPSTPRSTSATAPVGSRARPR